MLELWRRADAPTRMLSAPQRTDFDSNGGRGIPCLAHHPIATRGLIMHPFIQRDEDGETVFVVGHRVMRGPGKMQEWRAMVWRTTFFVSALLVTTMLTILTATAAEAKKCKTLRLPSG